MSVAINIIYFYQSFLNGLDVLAFIDSLDTVNLRSQVRCSINTFLCRNGLKSQWAFGNA